MCIMEQHKSRVLLPLLESSANNENLDSQIDRLRANKLKSVPLLLKRKNAVPNILEGKHPAPSYFGYDGSLIRTGQAERKPRLHSRNVNCRISQRSIGTQPSIVSDVKTKREPLTLKALSGKENVKGEPIKKQSAESIAMIRDPGPAKNALTDLMRTTLLNSFQLHCGVTLTKLA